MIYVVTLALVFSFIFWISFFKSLSTLSFHFCLLSSFLLLKPVRNSFLFFSSNTILVLVDLFIAFLGTVFFTPIVNFKFSSCPLIRASYWSKSFRGQTNMCCGDGAVKQVCREKLYSFSLSSKIRGAAVLNFLCLWSNYTHLRGVVETAASVLVIK